MDRIVCPKEYDYYERKKCIERIRDEYQFVKYSVIGRSCAGRDIAALKIGSASQYCLITAAFHGSERITSTILLMFIEELCNAIQNEGYLEGLNVKKALAGRGAIFVPCVNPDGCDISLNGIKSCGSLGNTIAKLCKNDFVHWNSNLRGVDLNHNFNAGWEQLREKERKEHIYGPGPTRFGGFRPESEPETLALTELCRTQNIRHVVALHSQGEVIYWTYGKSIPARSKKMAEIMATSCGYALDTPIGISDGGGFKDWFITEFGRPGFTVEVGKGTNPLSADSATDIYKRIREMLILCCIM